MSKGMSENRTRVLYTSWRISRKIRFIYQDESYIDQLFPGYNVHIGNQEYEFSTLDEAEKYLWNNWVAGEKEAGQI